MAGCLPFIGVAFDPVAMLGEVAAAVVVERDEGGGRRAILLRRRGCDSNGGDVDIVDARRSVLSALLRGLSASEIRAVDVLYNSNIVRLKERWRWRQQQPAVCWGGSKTKRGGDWASIDGYYVGSILLDLGGTDG